MTLRKRFVLILAFIAVALCAFALAACAKYTYDGDRDVPDIKKNDVLFIERNRLSFALGMDIDETDVIEKCNITCRETDGSEFKITADMLENGTVGYESFDLSTVGSNKQIALTYNDAVNYIYYDVNSYTANFYLDEEETELYKSVTASAQLTDTLGLSVWVNLIQQNFSTDERMRDIDERRTMKFNGWYDSSSNPVTGSYVFSSPKFGNERIVDFHAHYITDEQLAEMDVYYDSVGRRIFAGYYGNAETVFIPEGVTYIDFTSLFADGSPFKELIIPSTATLDIPFMSGINSLGLESIAVDEGNRQYASYNGALYSKDYTTLYFMPSDCANMEFHSALSEIGSYACSYWRISELNIPESVTTLQHYCFAYSQLSEIHGLGNVKTIKAGVFFGTNVNSFTDGVARYIVLDGENSGKLILSMMLDETITEYELAAGTIAITSNVFSRCDFLTSVNLGNELISIASSAFSGCEALESIELPSSLIEMGSSVFYGCTSLTTVTGMPDLRYVDDDGNEYAHTLPTSIFYGCSSLTYVELPDGLLQIAPSAFYGCTRLESIDIPRTVVNIGSSAFASCTSLATVSLPEGLRTFGNSVFYNSGLAEIDLEKCTDLTALSSSCFRQTKLTEVVIPDRIKNIPTYCFYNISTLKSVSLNKVTSVGTYAFGQNARLTDIDFGEVVTIGSSAFRTCATLKEVVLPDSVTTIGGYAFASCSRLESITLGKNVQSFGEFAFEGDGETFGAVSPVTYLCTTLKNIYVAEENEYFKSVDGVLYGRYVGGKDFGEGGVLYCVPSGNARTSYASEASTRIITPYAVHRQANLVTFTCNEGLENIGKAAFYSCAKLKGLNLPSTINFIGASILLSCANASTFSIEQGNSLYSTDGNIVYKGESLVFAAGATKTVNIKDGTTVIENGAFMNTSITEIIIPDSVVSIEDKAFNGCSNLTSIHIGKGLRYLNSTAFSLLKSLETITVSPDNQYFKVINNILYSKDGRTLVLAAAGNGLTELNIESGVKEISDYAFSYHKTLENIVLPDGIEKLGDYAFYECRGAAYLYCCRSLESIGAYAFSFAGPLSGSSKTMYSDTLKVVLFYENLSSIGDNAFYGQYGIEYTFFKMSYLQRSVLMKGVGSNSIYFTHGCSDGKGGYYNNYGFGIICALYSENEPTIDYDGYEWFYFDDNGKPELYKVIPNRNKG